MSDHEYLEGVRRQFRGLQRLGAGALTQVDDAALLRALDDESNSIAIIAKHMAGNMRSRWRDFLTTDGEKPDRHRDREFELEDGDDAAAIRSLWEEGWQVLFDAIDPLTLTDLQRTVTIRGEPHLVIDALQRQLAHYAYHVGQIVLLARHWCGPRWQSLSVPRGGSEAFNRHMRKQHP